MMVLYLALIIFTFTCHQTGRYCFLFCLDFSLNKFEFEKQVILFMYI